MEKRSEKYIYPYFENCSIKSIRPIDTQNFFDCAAICNLSSSVKEKLRFTLNGAFDSTIDNDFCYKNPVKNIVLPAYINVIKKQVYTIEQQKLILIYIKSNGCDKGIAILLKTGLRHSELLAVEIILKTSQLRLIRQ